MDNVVNIVVASTTQTITNIMGVSLPYIFAVVASLIALGIALHYIMRYIGISDFNDKLNEPNHWES